jgi:flavin reductase (DIM6/NTAB) family NADH-FMN oxidoreductase RutF
MGTTTRIEQSEDLMGGREQDDLVDDFKSAFRRFPAGVALIAAMGPDGPAGLTASSVASVSLDPVALSFSLAGTTRSAQIVLSAKTFVVHLMTADDIEIAQAFARPGAPRFTPEQRWSTLPSGEPVLASALVAMRCRHLHAIPVGDSTLVVAEVLDIRRNLSGGPSLLYYNREYRAVDDTTPVVTGDDNMSSAPGGALRDSKNKTVGAPQWLHRPLPVVCELQAFFVSQKILEISSIFSSSWSAVAGSTEFFEPLLPASFVASLNSWCSCGYFSKWCGLK